MESGNTKPTTNSSGPNFSMTLADNDSTYSFINKVASQVYPEGKVLIKGTTASQRGFEEKTLVSHNVEGIMAGNALSRNPAMASVAYDRLTTSSLESHLAFGSDFSVADVKDDRPAFDYPNPNYSGNKDLKDKSLSGPAAFKAAISNSVLGTSYAPGLFQQKAYVYGSAMVSDTTTDDGTNPDGANYQVSPDALGIGPAKNNYPASLISDLTDEEKEVYINAINTVNNNVEYNNGGILSSAGFAILATDAQKNYLEASGQINDKGKEAANGTPYERVLPEAFVNLPDPSSFYPSITLLKMLIEMTDPNGLELTVGLGLQRADLSRSDAIMSEERDEAKKIVSDHAFGRAIDIYAVGKKNVAGSKLSVTGNNYQKCFEMLMEKIATLPAWMQPDSIVIGKTMYNKYVSDPAQAKMVFLNKFPGLSKYVKIDKEGEKSTSHESHIHLGFHWTRAGSAAVFLGSDSAGGTTTTSPVATSVFKSTEEMNTYILKGQSTFTDPQESISPVDLGKIMATTGIFNIEEIAVFCGIAQRESNLRVHNVQEGNLLAIGLFQNELYNFIDGKLGSFSIMDFYIPEGTSTRFADQSGKRTLKGWQVYFSKETGITQSQLKSRKEMEGKWNGGKIDPVFWIPLNQIAIAAQVARIYKPTSSASSSKFSQFYKDSPTDRSVALSRNLWNNWGDGQWGDQSANQSWGAITNVQLQTVKEVYLALGGQWHNFVKWALGSRKAPGALCDAITVAQVEAAKRVKEGKTLHGAPYRSYWDVFIWVYDLFDEAINYFTTEEEKDQFTSKRWKSDVKVFAPGKRKTIFTQKIVEDIIKIPYLQYIANNTPRGA